jgi:hypothetical protein
MRVRGMEQDLTEFAEFYESTREDCLRIVLLNVGDRHLAQDLVAEAYTRAWVSWRKVRALDVPRPGSPAPRARLDARPGAIVSRAHRVRDRRGLSRKSTASASATCCSMVNGPSVTDGATPRWV